MTLLLKYFYLKSIFLTLVIFSCSNPKEPRISEIEHVYVLSENAPDQFEFFTETIGLPIVWEYENYGSFTSGGVSLGNLVLELIDANHSEQPHLTGSH